jgi:predicted nucleic acid-binding protein
MLTYLFDTSAWIAHIFQEPGWEYINALFEEDGSSIGICVVSLAELHGRLKALGSDEQLEPLLEFYRPLFDRIVPVDENVASRAIALRNAATDRLPSLDAFIAGAGSLHKAVLIHRDAHFTAIPLDLLQQRLLPEK